MIFGYFTLTVALIISAIAEYYSIVGLMAIFAASPIAVAVMGAALGVGKITGAVWLKINWARAKWTYKVYLCSAVVLLMMLTSIGCFGFLSKAHSDQSLVGGDVQSKIAIYDEKIKTAKENIEADRRQLRQMDEAVDQIMARSTTEEGATKSNAIRKTQARDRAALAKSIEANQKLIGVLNDEAAPIRAEVRKVEAEVGPIKYIAALIYGDNTDTNLLEAAVRWVIILIVAVFDPLALVLILAAQQSIRWAKDDRERQEQEKLFQDDARQELENDPELNITPDPYVADVAPVISPAYVTDEGPISEEVLAQLQTKAEEDLPIGEVLVKQTLFPDKSIFEQHPYLTSGFAHFKELTPMVHTPEPLIQEKAQEKVVDILDVERPDNYITSSEESISAKTPETLKRNKIMPPSPPETLNVRKHLQADNIETEGPINSFGTQFPTTANKGDMFLRVDLLPNRLFKYNSNKWIEVDKEKTDSYTYDEQYINFLIEKLQTGEYEIDQLSATEQELVAQKLQLQNDKT